MDEQNCLTEESATAIPLKSSQRLHLPGDPNFEKFRSLFKKFAKVGDERKNGLMMTRLNSFRWLRQSGICGEQFDMATVQACFKKIASPMTAVNINEFQEFLKLLAARSFGSSTHTNLMEKLVACGYPDSSKFRPQIGSDGDKPSCEVEHLQTFPGDIAKCARVRHKVYQERNKAFTELFRAYSMLDYRYSNGLVMSRRNAMYWFRKADILDKEISEEDFCYFFRCVVNAHLVMDSKEFRTLITHIARRIARKPEDVLTMLLRSEKPEQTRNNSTARSRRDPVELFRAPRRHRSSPSPTSYGDSSVSSTFAFQDSGLKKLKGRTRSFDDLFKLYGKLNDPSKTGVIITRLNTLVWFNQAGLLEQMNSHFCVMECFHQITRTQIVMNKTEFEKFIDAVSVKIFRSAEDILRKLIACGMPDLHQYKQVRAGLVQKTSSFRDIRLPVSMDSTVRFIRLPKYSMSQKQIRRYVSTN